GMEAMMEVLGQRLGYSAAWSALQGWKGDDGVVYRSSGHVCVAIGTALDSTAAADRLESAARAWAATLPGAAVTRRGLTVEIRSCDPGTSFRGPAPAAPAPFDVLSARSELLDQVVQVGDLPVPEGVCRVDSIIAQLGPAETTTLMAGQDPAAMNRTLAPAGRVAATICHANRP
ncbi:MAG TPA: hypothetical protein VF954_01910, partial [Acidimicrobiales bacterium]